MKWDFLRNFWRVRVMGVMGAVGAVGMVGGAIRTGRDGSGGSGGVGLYCFDGFFKRDTLGNAAT